MSEPILQLDGVTKRYRSGPAEVVAVRDVTFSVEAGESVAILGPSGSGKSTLLGICAGLDLADEGSARLLGSALEALDEDGRAELRRDNVGFVFQTFQLIPSLTALENVATPLELRGLADATRKAREALVRVGLGERLGHYPAQLSGGEQQRVALARAFVGEPAILFADEPTGNLDAETGAGIEDLLFAFNREAGATLVLVTHDLELAGRTSRSLRMQGGRLSNGGA